MKIAIASFTRNGCVWNQKLCAALKKHSCEGYALEKYGKEAGIPAIAPSLPAWTERMFQKMDAILFIGACGIAVRSIAPYVKSKKTDPAVLCMDEQGKFVISLLSGHIGGANELTEEVAAVTGAVPVITTATDVNHKFAVDVFAVKNHCEICEMELAKETAALLVDGKTVGFCSRFPVALILNIAYLIRVVKQGFRPAGSLVSICYCSLFCLLQGFNISLFQCICKCCCLYSEVSCKLIAFAVFIVEFHIVAICLRFCLFSICVCDSKSLGVCIISIGSVVFYIIACEIEFISSIVK